MRYSSGITKKPFWFLESKKTANYILEGFNREEIFKIAVEKNIYQVETENRVKTIVHTCFNRLNSLPKIILKNIINTDLNTSKILVLISIMKTDKLFFEFIYEIFRNKVILGEKYLENKDLNIFFEEKKLQSDIVSSWSELNIKKLKSSYLTILFNSGLINRDNGKNEVVVPIIDYSVEQSLLNNDFSPYLKAINGEN
ncbi:MAG: DUF1819 family protein [Methanobrevibacter sp.]|jgi:hypothetical protein|nr:DUF1819 family protein [Methanobrevibacter sp.]